MEKSLEWYNSLQCHQTHQTKYLLQKRALTRLPHAIQVDPARHYDHLDQRLWLLPEFHALCHLGEHSLAVLNEFAHAQKKYLPQQLQWPHNLLNDFSHDWVMYLHPRNALTRALDCLDWLPLPMH